MQQTNIVLVALDFLLEKTFAWVGSAVASVAALVVGSTEHSNTQEWWVLVTAVGVGVAADAEYLRMLYCWKLHQKKLPQ